MKILYFTSTGNSLEVAKKIGGELLSIPQMIKENRYDFEDDVIGIVVPVYAFSIPKIVKRFMSKAKIKAEYVFAIATCGGTSGVALVKLEKLAYLNNYKINYSKTVFMADNYLPMYESESEIRKIPERKIDEQIANVIKDIENKVNNKSTGSVPAQVMAGAGGFILSGKAAQKFMVDETCNLCGTCAKVCPVSNIEVTDKVLFGDKCEVCYGCVHNCPQNSIHVKKEKSHKRYRNENVTLNELIKSNNQN